jgi:predicted metal-dependent phosphoesterase TrpH
MTLRVAAHAHSDWSYDGSWSLAALARALRRRGYDAVLMAEHDRGFDAARWADYRAACAAASGPDLVVVPGIEYSDADNLVHVPTWGASAFLGAARPTAELVADAQARGGVCLLAHPARRDAWRSLDVALLERFDAVEAWNRKYDGWAASAVGCRLAAAHGLPAFVGLDFHTARQFAPLAMAVELDGQASAAAIEDALRARRAQPRVAGVALARLTTRPGRDAARAAEAARRRARRLAGRSRRAARGRGRRRRTPSAG